VTIRESGVSRCERFDTVEQAETIFTGFRVVVQIND